MEHLFISCSFSMTIWQQVMGSVDYFGEWKAGSVELWWWQWICNKHMSSFK